MLLDFTDVEGAMYQDKEGDQYSQRQLCSWAHGDFSRYNHIFHNVKKNLRISLIFLGKDDTHSTSRLYHPTKARKYFHIFGQKKWQENFNFFVG